MTDPYSLGMLRHLGINQEEDEPVEEESNAEIDAEKEQRIETNRNNTAAYLESLRHTSQAQRQAPMQAPPPPDYTASYQAYPYQQPQPIYEQFYDPYYAEQGYNQPLPYQQEPYQHDPYQQATYQQPPYAQQPLLHDPQIEKIVIQWLEKNVPILLNQMAQAQKITKKKKR